MSNKHPDYPWLTKTQVEVMGALAFAGLLFIVVLFLSRCSTADQASTAAVPYDIIEKCRTEIRQSARHPSTVRFSLLAQSADVTAPGNGFRVGLGFTAKNSFGLEIEHEAFSVFGPNKSRQIVRSHAREIGS